MVYKIVKNCKKNVKKKKKKKKKFFFFFFLGGGGLKNRISDFWQPLKIGFRAKSEEVAAMYKLKLEKQKQRAKKGVTL